MAKDPAVLFFIDTWLVATKEMKADCRGWYLNLILHQFDKKDLPNDVEELANLADVRVSEFTRFEQVFEQVLKQKFELKPNGRLANEVANEIIRKREEFKDKRSEAGKISYFLRYARKHLCKDENVIQFVRNKIDFKNFDVKNEQMFEQVFKQLSELYNGNGNGDGNGDITSILLNTEIKEEESSKLEEGGKDEDEALKLHLQKQKEDMVVVEMMKIWMKHNPNYFEEKENDYSSCLQLAYKIARYKKWKESEVIAEREKDVLVAWEKICQFIRSDQFLKKLSLTNICNQFQLVVQKMNNPSENTLNGQEGALKSQTSHIIKPATDEMVDKYRKPKKDVTNA